jgi:hypothetical protein
MSLVNRSDLAFECNRRSLLGIAVEVGVAEGWLSEENLKNWKGAQYVMVDPWRKMPEWTDLEHLKQSDLDFQYNEIVRKHGNNPRLKIMRTTSETAAKTFADGSLDWVYLDANHRYDFILADLGYWYPKVKPGGIISGHDYEEGYGVKPAVADFVKDKGLTVNVTEEKWCPSFWIVKP